MNKILLVSTAVSLLLAGGTASAQSFSVGPAPARASGLLRVADNFGGQNQPTEQQNDDDTWDGPGYYVESPASYASDGFRFPPMKYGGPFATLSACQQYHQTLKAAFGKKDDEHCIYRGSSVRYGQVPCFLTTACVQHAGLRDDCDELMLMRVLRDRYLDKFDEGRRVIDRYYEIAPPIVDTIRRAPDAHRILGWILREVRATAHCVARGDMETAMVRYAAMVLRLEQRLGDGASPDNCGRAERYRAGDRHFSLSTPGRVNGHRSFKALLMETEA